MEFKDRKNPGHIIILIILSVPVIKLGWFFMFWKLCMKLGSVHHFHYALRSLEIGVYHPLCLSISETLGVTDSLFCRFLPHFQKMSPLRNEDKKVWQQLAVARDQLFGFIQKVWDKETVPPNLALCIFVMMFKNKGSPDR